MIIHNNNNNRLIISASYDKQIKVWTMNGVLLETLKGHDDLILDLESSPSQTILASAGFDNKVIIWNFYLEELLKKGCLWLGDYHSSRNEKKIGEQICISNN